MDLTSLPIGLSIGIALIAGVTSFISPCVAPLLPGYIAFLAGENDSSSSKNKTLIKATGFVFGFIILFAAMGATAVSFSRVLIANRAELELISGILVALFGLAMIFDRRILPNFLTKTGDATIGNSKRSIGFLTAMPIGAAFAVAWSPCIGPALGAILALAAGQNDPAKGALLLVIYGVGLGLPFLAGAVALERVSVISRALRRHAPAIRIAGGVLLLLFGVLIGTGEFGRVTSLLASLTPRWLV